MQGTKQNLQCLAQSQFEWIYVLIFVCYQVVTAIQYSNIEYNSNYSQPIWKRKDLIFSAMEVPAKLNHDFANFGPYVYNVFYKLVSHHLTVSPMLSTTGNQIQVGCERFRNGDKDGVTYEVSVMNQKQDEPNIKLNYTMPSK